MFAHFRNSRLRYIWSLLLCCVEDLSTNSSFYMRFSVFSVVIAEAPSHLDHVWHLGKDLFLHWLICSIHVIMIVILNTFWYHKAYCLWFCYLITLFWLCRVISGSKMIFELCCFYLKCLWILIGIKYLWISLNRVITSVIDGKLNFVVNDFMNVLYLTMCLSFQLYS